MERKHWLAAITAILVFCVGWFWNSGMKFGGVGFPSSGDANFKTANFSYTSSTIQSVAGSLHTVTINSTGTGGFILYDATSTKTTKLLTVSSTESVGSFIYDIRFQNGLIVSSTGGVINPDVTISYQ